MYLSKCMCDVCVYARARARVLMCSVYSHTQSNTHTHTHTHTHTGVIRGDRAGGGSAEAHENAQENLPRARRDALVRT